MNRGSLNTTSINSAPVSGLRRLVFRLVSHLRPRVRGRVLHGAQVQATGRFAPTARPRAEVSGSLSVLARIQASIRSTVSTATDIIIRARLRAAGRVAPRRYVGNQVRAVGRVVVAASGRTAVGASVAVTVAARVRVSPQAFMIHRALLTALVRAVIRLNAATRRQLPYDEDAPLERVMLVPRDSRTMAVH